MRPPNQAARDQLRSALARRPGVAAAALAQDIGVSVATLHRMLQEHAGQVLASGRARRARYALRRPLRGDAADLPVYAVDEDGRAELLAQLSLVYPEGSRMALQGSVWPVPEDARDGWWPGLPYPLYDMRPQGYLGRQFARAHHRLLAVSNNPNEWSDDDITFVLSRSGADTAGNLILGNAAFEQWQASKLEGTEPIKPRALARAYAQLAEQAVASGVAGSSAAGEFPKFPALRERAGSHTPHVLVKFSGADGSATVRRWADLLVCEHLALQALAALPGVHAARSGIVSAQGRTFLEVERFDRHGDFGRSPLVSLATLDAALIGDGSSDWVRLAERLADAGWLSQTAVQQVQTLWWFGRLIANSDMHTGNLSLRTVANTNGSAALSVAPAYDMLPMLYAPLPGGELPRRHFEPPLPLPPQRAAWQTACAAAIGFWHSAAADPRVSPTFQRECATNAVRLDKLLQRV
jgi:HipA-like C-terminal domain